MRFEVGGGPRTRDRSGCDWRTLGRATSAEVSAGAARATELDDPDVGMLQDLEEFAGVDVGCTYKSPTAAIFRGLGRFLGLGYTQWERVAARGKDCVPAMF